VIATRDLNGAIQPERMLLKGLNGGRPHPGRGRPDRIAR